MPVQAVGVLVEGLHVVALVVAEQRAVDAGVRIEAQLPQPTAGQPDLAVLLRLGRQVDHHDHIIAGPMIEPALVDQQVRVLVDVVDVQPAPGQAPGEAAAVQPQVDQVGVEPRDALEVVIALPIQRHVVAEPAAFEELLALEHHRDTRRGHHQRRPDRRALLRRPTGRVRGLDLLRDTRPPVGHLIVRLGVDDALHRVAVVVADRVSERLDRALRIVRGDQLGAHRVHEGGVPLCVETGAVLVVLSDLGVLVQVFGDHDAPRELAAHRIGDAPHQRPTLVQVVALVGVHVRHHVEPQPVDAVFA